MTRTAIPLFFLVFSGMIGVHIAGAAEGRIPIDHTRIGIGLSEPGAYIVTEDLNAPSTDAIVITGNNIAIDLGGHTVSSTSGWAVSCSGATNIKVYHGQLSGGLGGVFYSKAGGNVTLEDLDISVTAPPRTRETGFPWRAHRETPRPQPYGPTRSDG